MTTPIAPCPFCGDSDPAIDEIDIGIWALVCNGCMTIGPHQDGAQSSEQAIERWNARCDPAAVLPKHNSSPTTKRSKTA